MTKTKAIYTLTIPRALKSLQTRRSGLTSKEARLRLKRDGPNTLPTKKSAPALFIFFRQFKSELVYILLIAAVVTFVIGENIDSAVIVLAVSVNVVVGFFQEFQAERALDALSKIVAVQATVLRDGKEVRIDASKLVPGDIVHIGTGAIVPADLRVIEATFARTNEAMLTGESHAVEKTARRFLGKRELAERANMMFSGTLLVEGTALGVVAATGRATEVGKIAELLKNVKEEPTPLQKKMGKLSRLLGIIVLAMSFAVFVLGSVMGNDLHEMFSIAIALAVSAIPEGLLIGVTIVLALGMREILKQNALVRNLLAAETLGSTTVICADKTGTLTLGHMNISRVVSLNYHVMLQGGQKPRMSNKESYEILYALKIGVLSNNAHIERSKDDPDEFTTFGNPTEQALLLAGQHLGLVREDLEKETPRIAEIPFDSSRKYMATLHNFGNEKIVYVKGAPERILRMSTRVKDGDSHKQLTEATRKRLEDQFKALSSEGLRVLAVAHKHTKEKDMTDRDLESLTFVAFVCLEDPLRNTSKQTIATARRAGIQVVMITGDSRFTATKIAKELKFKTGAKHIIEGAELDMMSTIDLEKRVKDITVYARVSPEHKLRIINAWKARGEVVAMTGDGTNDSPALKRADIGVALGSGTDVAKEASDMVLLDDRFGTIVKAVEQGRVIFDNLKKITLYLLSDSFAEIVLIAGSMLMGLPLPILATQILWVNIIDDSLPNIALTKESKEGDVMKLAPRGHAANIIDKRMTTLIGVISVIAGLANLALFVFVYRATDDIVLARSIVFTSLAVDSLLYVFSVRSLRHSVFTRSPFSNPYLLGAVTLGFVFQIAVLYIPLLQDIFQTVGLGAVQWGIVLGVAAAEIIVIELVKHIFIVRRDQAQGATV